MTPKGAFKVLKNTLIRTRGCNVAYSKALHLAMAALEKQIPKKVAEYKKDSYCCTMCGAIVYPTSPYCKHCGQALDWSDTE